MEDILESGKHLLSLINDILKSPAMGKVSALGRFDQLDPAALIGQENTGQYHDTDWGVPVYDDQKLFEFLVLEGAQANRKAPPGAASYQKVSWPGCL